MTNSIASSNKSVSLFEIEVVNPDAEELGDALGIDRTWIEESIKPVVNGEYRTVHDILVRASKQARNANELMFLGFMIAVNLTNK
jgi:hypothetical protein